MYFIAFLGDIVISLCTELGKFIFFLMRAVKAAFSKRQHHGRIIAHMRFIGADSLPIVFLTGLCTGLALALQSYIGFRRISAEQFIGPVVALAMTRELGPVLTGIMITGRAGSAMAAELGTMQVTEQIDALRTLCVDPFHYLIVPRIIASVCILPCVTLFAMICGIGGGCIYCSTVLEINPEIYIAGIREFCDIQDILGGLVKAAFFGLIIAWVGTYMGYYTSGGARGVGKATTKSVVIGSLLILIANYLLSTLLYNVGIA
jgi:phospholipid/cholesterol/gamma-HCH transport system permease protein